MRSLPLLAALLLSACSSSEPAANSVAQAQNPEPRDTAEALPAPSARPAPVRPPADITLPPRATSAQTGSATGPALAVEGEGLRLFARDTGRARPIPFGTPRAEVERALAFRGSPGTGTQADCGAGPLAYAVWPDGLKLYYQKGRFTGWALDGRAAGRRGPVISTAAGVGPGSTRAQLTDAAVATFEKTSLGLEFRSGAISGVVEGSGPAAKITDMWAGVICVFR
jgi:hypothetical protein